MPARRLRTCGLLALALTLAIALAIGNPVDASTANAAASAPEIKLRNIATLGDTTALAVRDGDSALYVTEQAGRVRAIRKGKMAARPVLDISDETSSGSERGLLGLAFAPDGSRLYANFTDTSGDTRVEEFTMNGRVADKESRREILLVDQPQGNHNGGQLAFGPDGMLYIGLGDGGASNDEGPGHATGGNAQSLRTLLGKILRIDPTPAADAPYTVPSDNPFVTTSGARPEIWSFGLRNPWRFSFDAETGDLWIGDVGQNAWEEVDFAPAANGRDAGGGANFGWNRLEGTHPLRGRAPDDSVLPVHEYENGAGGCSVTGGFVYRGARIAVLRGVYVFSDYCNGDLVALEPNNRGTFRLRDLGVELPSIASFGEGPDRELYALSQSRGIFRLVPAS